MLTFLLVIWAFAYNALPFKPFFLHATRFCGVRPKKSAYDRSHLKKQMNGKVHSKHPKDAGKEACMPAADKREDLLNRVLAAHEAYYDIRRDYRFEGKWFPAFAEFHTYGEKYVLTKRAKLWEVNTHDFMFFELADKLDEDALSDAVNFITTKAIRKVDPSPNHMSSALTLVIIANQCTNEAFKQAKSTRFRKIFYLGFRGWTDLRLAVVDLSRESGKEVVTNAAGKQLKDALVSNLALAQ